MSILRGVENQTWRLFAFERATGIPATGKAATITAQISKDDGGFAATATANPTEEADGYYELPLSQDETNAVKLDLIPSSSDPDIQVVGIPATTLTIDPATQFTMADVLALIQSQPGAVGPSLTVSENASNNLTAAISSITAEIASIAARPKPFYVEPAGPGGQGRLISAVEYRRFLHQSLMELIEARQAIEEPWVGSVRIRTGRF